MNTFKINREKTELFSAISNELSYRQETFSNFIQTPFSKNAFQEQIQLKQANYSNQFRTTLVTVLREQYKHLNESQSVQSNIELLSQTNTFTVTTGHQLSLFTGPLYFIYKILHVIKLCNELKESFPDKHFVPVFWMASEDHDFEEINHFSLFGKKISWESNQKGPVGRFELDGLEAIRQELHTFFQNNPESEIHQLIDSYQGVNLSEAQFKLVHELFKDYGLIIIEPDNALLKQLFIPTIEKEIFERFAENKVNQTTEKLIQLGYKGQVFPRPINFFWIENGIRERIQWQNNAFFIEGKGTISASEMKNLIHSSPANFSPNVVFRPVYQETILPNLCYVGGGGEMAYWLQLKGVFDQANIIYPLIQVRNSLQIIDSVSQKKMQKLALKFTDFLYDIDTIKRSYIHENTQEEFNRQEIQLKVEELKQLLKTQIIPIDTQLDKFVEMENNKLDKLVESIESKVLRAQKQKLETTMKQLEDIKNRLFPYGSLQERVDSFLNFCPSGNVSQLIHTLYHAIEPFERDLILIE